MATKKRKLEILARHQPGDAFILVGEDIGELTVAYPVPSPSLFVDVSKITPYVSSRWNNSHHSFQCVDASRDGYSKKKADDFSEVWRPLKRGKYNDAHRLEPLYGNDD